jgi:hypothetical protein
VNQMSSKNFKVKEGLDVNGTVTAPSILTPVIEVPVPLSFVPTAALCMFGDYDGPLTFSAFTALGSEYLNLPIGTVITIPDGLTFGSGTPIYGSGTYTILSATSQEYGVDYALQMGTGAGFGGMTYGGGYVEFDPTSLTILFSVTTGSAGTAGQVLQSTGTGLEWADAASGSGLPSLGSNTTASLSTMLNVSVGYNYDQENSPTQVVLTPYGTIDDAALAEFNIAVPGTTNFTLTFVDIGMGIDYSTTFTKTGAAENVMGMQITIPVQYVSGDILAGATDPTISYGTSSAGKYLTNDGTNASWETVREVPALSGITTTGLHTIINGGTSVSYGYDQLSFPTTVSVTPYAGINNDSLAEFNSLVQGGTEFTISYVDIGMGIDYSTTFIKTGAAMDPNGAGTIEIPVQYVSGNTMVSTTDPSITYGTSSAGKFLTNDGTTYSWTTLPAGLPSLGSNTTASLSTMLNVSVGYNYDQENSPTQVVLTPYGTIDDAALAEFNIAVPGTTNFTLTFVDIGMGIDYSTTFTKTGAAENVMGMQITIPVQYVSGDILAGATDPTISYGTSSAGKYLTNDGTNASWGDLKSSASGALSGSGTASWSSSPVNTYPSGNPYGIKTINGQKRIIMPNVANFQNMPIGSTVNFADEYYNNGVGGAPTTNILTTTGLYDGSGFDISGDPFDTETSDPGGNHTFYISWTGTEPEHTITADDLRLLSPDAAGSVHHQLDMVKIIPASGTIYGSEMSVKTTQFDAPYGRFTHDGKTFARIPNMANLDNMPINSSLNVSIMRLTCIDGMCGFSGGGYIYSAGDLLSTYDGYKVEVPYDPNQTDEALPTNDQYFYTEYWTVSWEGSNPEQSLSSNDFKKLKSNPKIYLKSFEGNPENKTETVSYTWTVPQGVYGVYATLIGGGGAPGMAEAQASSQNGSASQQLNYGNAFGGDTTIVYNGTTYTAKGGAKGLGVFDSAQTPNWDFFTMPNGGGGSGTGSNTYFGQPGDRRPGRGGIGVNVNASANSNNTIPINGTNRYFEVTAKANATSHKGNDGDVKYFTIPVVPGSTLNLSVGQNGGEEGWGPGSRLGSASSNAGAIYLRYVK